MQGEGEAAQGGDPPHTGPKERPRNFAHDGKKSQNASEPKNDGI